MDWRVLLDSDWELFGGEINLSGVDCHTDSVAVHADSSEAEDWQAVEDDVLSLCSSAASWSCLHGNSLLETCNFLLYCLLIMYILKWRFHRRPTLTVISGPYHLGDEG